MELTATTLKTKRIVLWICAILFCATAILRADAASGTALTEMQAWLDTKPAVKPGDAVRNEKLLKLDPIFMAISASSNPAVGKYFKARMKAAMDEIESASPAQGEVIIWKLYNHSEILKSREATFAVDVITGPDRAKWNAEDISRMVKQCDALVVTHGHFDHADIAIAKKFLAAGKKVITPPGIWDKLPGMSAVTLIRDGSMDVNGVKLTAFPSFQSADPNNVYIFEFPGGVRVLDTGDENGKSFVNGSGWLDAVKGPIPVDVFIYNTWSQVTEMLLAVFPSKMLIPAHEYELSHGPQSRTTYAGMISKSKSLGVPFVMMAWGEKIVVKK